MVMIEITEHKMDGLVHHVEKGLKHLGEAMVCLEKMKQHSRYNERDDEDFEEDEYMDERYGNRGRMNRRSGGGRYSRY